jgi:hypothetical protein
MNNRWIRVAMVAMLFAVAAPVAHADDDGDDNGTPSTVAPLTGEVLIAQEIGQGSDISESTVTGTCIPAGMSVFTFEITGLAEGPYGGTFIETGTVTLDGLGAAEFASEFTIFSDAGNVEGSKFDASAIGFCIPVGIEPGGDSLDFQGTVSYTAEITAPTGTRMDSGTSFVSLQDFQVRGVPDSNGFSFLETFTSTEPPGGGGDDDDDDDDDDGGDDDDDGGDG